ncbi:MAG TPA: hypothetical protein VNI54_02355 [Thermoanaerobaculia bacterium]|nr:hypothetical protein [Thermoanaerobaculia bacterium]
MRGSLRATARLRHHLLEDDPRILGAVVGAAACAHVHQDRRPASLREREHLLDSREMGGVAQGNAGIAEVELDAGHVREAEASLQLFQRDGAQRIGAAEADQARGVLRHLRGSPVVLFAGEPVRIGEVLALVGEAVADREHDRAIDSGRVQLPDQRGAVAFRHLHDGREGGVHEMLVIVDDRRGTRRRRLGGEQRCDRKGERSSFHTLCVQRTKAASHRSIGREQVLWRHS